MRFNFTYPVTVCDQVLAEIEGVAIVDTRHELQANRGNAYWHISGLLFETTDEAKNTVLVSMRPEHELYRPIVLWLLQTWRSDIDAAWLALNIETVGQAA